jgi:hypothetical protein
MRRAFLFCVSTLPLAAFIACSGDPADVGPAADAGPDRREASVTPDPPEGDAGAPDAEKRSACEATRAYTLACGRDLLCGTTGYDTWCKQQETLLSSTQLIEAQIACSTPTRCDATLRRDCQYVKYAAPLTAAQEALLRDFCRTCAPGGEAACEATALAYDRDAGPDGVTDLFLAVWESSDALATEMAQKCTGAQLDAGADAGFVACEKTFGQCAGGVYVDRLPNCP